MIDNKYFSELGKIPASRLNKMMYAINCKAPKDEIGLKSEVEENWFNGLIKEATAHENKYGVWSVFEMAEIEYDDPVLDIYNEPVKG